MNGVYAVLVNKWYTFRLKGGLLRARKKHEAATLAKEYHKGQVDKEGVDYFEGHLTTVGNAGHDWKEKIAGFLHDVAEDTPHTVDEIICILKDKSKGVLNDEDAMEIKEALTILNAKH